MTAKERVIKGGSLEMILFRNGVKRDLQIRRLIAVQCWMGIAVFLLALKEFL
jgi:hypothetical protein